MEEEGEGMGEEELYEMTAEAPQGFSSNYTDADACTCDPCECDLSDVDPNLICTEEEGGRKVCTRGIDKAGMLPKQRKGQECTLEECTCDPCECDPRVPTTECYQNDNEFDECTCDPCECDLKSLSARSKLPRSQEIAVCEYPGNNNECDVCTCNPCECDSRTPSIEFIGKGSSVNYNPLQNNFEDECTCDPCECDIKDRTCPPSKRFTYTLPPTPIPSDHTFENLNRVRNNFCRKVFPKNLGAKLTEDVLVDVLVKNSFGDFEMILPGNQISPGFLSQRIRDEDIPVIVNTLLEIRGITKVKLCYNEITDKGIELLAPALQECANIIEVDLMQNCMTAQGVLSLCRALMHRSPLHSLRLTGMKIGDEGMRALTCLILTGRAPYDLDVGECDLTVEGFQTLCSALHAMDHDIDYPSYLLLKNNLPMELVRLKESKMEYNEEVGHITALNRKISQPTFVRVRGDQKVAPTTCTKANQSDLQELFETFSATILQGLFDLRHRFNEEQDDELTKEIVEDKAYKPLAAGEMMLAEVEKIIENFNKCRNGNNPDELEDPSAQLVARSLYSLDVVDEEIFGQSVPETIQREELLEIEAREDTTHPPDSFTAEAAATHVVRESIYTASKHAASSEFKDRSDVTQLLLATVLETIDTIHAGINLTEDDCQRILEDAIEKTCRFIFPRMPPDCNLSPDDISCFFKVLFNISHGTFFQLFENSYVIQALADKGTIACSERKRLGSEQIVMKQGAMTFQQVRQIAVSYLHGIFVEAARVIGVSNPFGLEEDPKNDLAVVELRIQSALAAFMQTAGTFAAATKLKARSVEDTDMDYKNAADYFVIDLFENVNKMVVEMDMKQKVFEMDSSGGPTTYKYVSRPTRLVFNRPMFGPHAEIMGAKLGDYLSENTSVSALHIQKWTLNEDGMCAFMEPLMSNTTLVTLDLACNQLAADGMRLLGRYIARNKNLKHLILNNNRIRDAGMAHLNLGIPQSSIVSLDIANNGITYRELDPLLTTLPATHIRALYMWGNKFGLDSWNILKILYDEEILTTSFTDVVLQKVDNQRMIVKNMQVRDMNEYYEVPAVADYGLRMPPSYIDESSKLRNRTTVSSTNVNA